MAVHTKQKNTEANYQLLLSTFAANETLSIADIQSLLNCNRQSAYNYINRLKENGCQLRQKTIHNKSYYTLDPASSKDQELASFAPLTANIARKYHIVQCLQQKPVAKKELWESMHETIDIGRTAFLSW